MQNFRNNVKFLLLLFLLFFIALSNLNALANLSAYLKISTTGIIQSQTGRWSIRAVVVFPYDDYYSRSGMDTKLDEIRTRLPEVNYIEIRTYWVPDPNNPNNITHTDGDEGYLGWGVNSWSELDAAVNKIHARGLKVILWLCQYWSSDGANPTSWSEWLINYAKYAKSVARWAQSRNVSIFVIGAEYEGYDYSILTYENEWNNIITQVRSAFTGEVVYGFNWWYESSQWETVYNATWISNLDYIQIDSFQSLGTNIYDVGGNGEEAAKYFNPTLKDLMGNWTNSRFGPGWNYTQMYEQLATRYNKKIIIDVGYRNNNGTSTMPWTDVPFYDFNNNPIPGSGTDVKEMNDCWEAFFRVWMDSPVVIGVDLEHYTQPNTNSRDGSFRNKYDSITGIYTWQVIHKWLSALA